jgi:hypothetical protein
MLERKVSWLRVGDRQAARNGTTARSYPPILCADFQSIHILVSKNSIRKQYFDSGINRKTEQGREPLPLAQLVLDQKFLACRSLSYRGAVIAADADATAGVCKAISQKPISCNWRSENPFDFKSLIWARSVSIIFKKSCIGREYEGERRHLISPTPFAIRNTVMSWPVDSLSYTVRSSQRAGHKFNTLHIASRVPTRNVCYAIFTNLPMLLGKSQISAA